MKIVLASEAGPSCACLPEISGNNGRRTMKFMFLARINGSMMLAKCKERLVKWLQNGTACAVLERVSIENCGAELIFDRINRIYRIGIEKKKTSIMFPHKQNYFLIL